MKRDIVIIGAGAAGLICASESARRGRSVTVLDHAGHITSKVKISGGGRCNFTNLHVSPNNYSSLNPHFCKSALAQFSPADFLALLEKHRIRYHEKQDGQLFCTDGSGSIIRMLRTECDDAGVEILLNCTVSAIRKNDVFTVTTSRGIFESSSVVIATGGLSFPGLGATDFGYLIARNFGIKVAPVRPALVPLTFAGRDLRLCQGLSGISIDASATCNSRTFRGNILFTHRGMSGPAILQTSLYWEKGNQISIDLLPETDTEGLFQSKRRSKILMQNLLASLLPKRFVQAWCPTGIQSKPLNLFSSDELNKISSLLHDWKVTPHGTEGFSKAEVTAGGIDTDELSSKTMEAKKVPGLYFIGEVIDVTGQLGGYNLHWAWASGFAAGQYA